jgi:hypothetical protein
MIKTIMMAIRKGKGTGILKSALETAEPETYSLHPKLLSI